MQQCLDCYEFPCFFIYHNDYIERVLFYGEHLGLPDREVRKECKDQLLRNLDTVDTLPPCVLRLIDKTFPDKGY